MTSRTACANVASQIPAYVNGSLGPEAMRTVAAHLADCPACRHEVYEWRLIVAATHRAAAGPSPSPAVLDRVRATIDLLPVSRKLSRHNLWSRMTGNQRQPSPGDQVDPGHGWYSGYPGRPVRSTISEIAVLAAVILVLAGGMIGRDWSERGPGPGSPATQVQPSPPSAQPPTTGGLSFSSLLSNQTIHPGANLRLGRLTIEPGSSSALGAADSPVVLMVEAGIINGLVDGPATVTHGVECELAGQIQELTAGERFELQPSDYLLIPAGTSSELDNDGQPVAQALDLRIQAPGPPPGFTNGSQYRQLVQVPAKDLPSGQLQFTLTEGSLTTGAVHEIDGPGVLYLEAGTLEVTDTNADLEIGGNDDLEDDDAIDRRDSDPNERIAPGGWFSLDQGEHASLFVPDEQVTYLELRFELQEMDGQDP